MDKRPFWVRWLVLMLAVWVAAELLRGIEYDAWTDIALAALVLTALLYRRLTAGGARGPTSAAMGSVYEGL